jgi:hypothetical protein
MILRAHRAPVRSARIAGTVAAGAHPSVDAIRGAVGIPTAVWSNCARSMMRILVPVEGSLA